MARPQRIELPGALYLLSTQSAGDTRAFGSDADRTRFLDVLAQVVSRTRWDCYAYCLSPRRYDLLVRTPEGNLSRGMRQLNGVYTQRFNERHQRSGQLFSGRFKAVLVEAEAWMAPALASVLARRRQVSRGKAADRWQLSSYAATLGERPPPAWLDVKEALRAFAPTPGRARRALLKQVEDPTAVEQVEAAIRGQIFLGSDEFIAGLRKGRRKPSRSRRAAPALRSLLRGARNDPKAAMAEAYLSGAYNMGEIARHFGVHHSTVSRAVRDFENARSATG